MHGEGPTIHELVDHMASIGVEDREARLYLHLVLQGPSRASDAAAATRLKRTETYRALESLMKRGFVTAHLARPVVYEAVAPDALFAELLAGHDQRRQDLQELRARVVAAAQTARDRTGAGDARHSYKIVQGRRPILAALEGGLRNARTSLAMASTTFGLAQTGAQARAFQTLVRRAADGLEMRILLRESPGLERALQPLTAHRNVQVRWIEREEPLRFSIVDGREIVYWLVTDPAPGLDARDDVAMWTNATEFVRAQQEYFELLWPEAREAPRLAAR